MSNTNFATQRISSWSDFLNLVASKDRDWIHRGQPTDDPLTSSFERTLLGWGIDLKEGPEIEHQLIREFRRRIDDPVYQRIHDDTLYCMALMRHYGAPVRLIDCSYSPFVAAKFALERGGREAVIYSFNGRWFSKNVDRLFPDIFSKRRMDTERDDRSFCPMYQPISPYHPKQFVYHENPLYLNERLTIQQGVFLCPGDVGQSFLDNLKALFGWDAKENIIKSVLVLDTVNLTEFAAKLKAMNLSSAALFPGLEGFARSLGEHILHFRDLARLRTGLN